MKQSPIAEFEMRKSKHIKDTWGTFFIEDGILEKL